MGHTLFTYRNLKELRKIQEEREVFAFIFGETKDMLDSCSEVCIDISALVHFLLSNKNNIETTYINFTSIAEDTVVIAEAGTNNGRKDSISGFAIGDGQNQVF